ncbi:hypothetical protein ARSEF4850_009709, partial [Beauveria asiatica]
MNAIIRKYPLLDQWHLRTAPRLADVVRSGPLMRSVMIPNPRGSGLGDLPDLLLLKILSIAPRTGIIAIWD